MELAQWHALSNFDSPSPHHNNRIPGYRPQRYSQGIFYPKGCFEDASASSEDHNDGLYCAGNTVIMVLSFVNACVFLVLLVFHFKARRRSEPWKTLLLKVKTMILVLIIALELSVFIRYTFNIESKAVYDALLITSGFVQSIILFQICYFYTKKAAHFLEDNKKIR